MTPQEPPVAEMVARYEQGQSFKEIAKWAGMSHTTVGRRLRAAGVTTLTQEQIDLARRQAIRDAIRAAA